MKRLIFGLIATAFLAACGETNVGQSCTVNEDCDPGLSCYTDRPGGYCTKGCSEVGSDKECPGGSLCATNGGQVLCSPECKEQSDCRENYQCNGVSGSNMKVCAPK